MPYVGFIYAILVQDQNYQLNIVHFPHVLHKEL